MAAAFCHNEKKGKALDFFPQQVSVEPTNFTGSMLMRDTFVSIFCR